MHALITGAAGFIGFHLARRLLDDGWTVTGVDAFTPYYDRGLKEARHAQLEEAPGYEGHRFNLCDAERTAVLVARARPDVVVHLAAQAGVRHSLDDPRAYVDANIEGTFNLIEAIRPVGVRHLLLASTSSVYGASDTVPFRESDKADHPLTIYAASKKATEALAHCYSHLWAIPTTAMRFFTVYGPWGRPDMAPSLFADAILAGRPIDVFNNGRMERDFTWIGDLVEAMTRLVAVVPGEGKPVAGDSLSPVAPYRVVNIGAGAPTPLMDFIAALEAAMGKTAVHRCLPMQKGDVPRTFASADLLQALTGYRPNTSIHEGVGRFAAWFSAYSVTSPR